MSRGARRLLCGVVVFVGACSERADDPCGDTSICEPGERCFEAPCDAARRCRFGLEARLYGRSSAAEGGCVATDTESCSKSELTCGVWGQCAVAPARYTAAGNCPPRAKDRDYQASFVSACTGSGTCIAAKDADCRAAHVCRLAGRCNAVEGVCRATDVADCLTSALCLDAGLCKLDMAGRCVAQSAADCSGTANCDNLGHCGFMRGTCALCKKTPGCANEGLCVPRDGRCQATKLEHCQRASACRRSGRCKLIRGGCAK